METKTRKVMVRICMYWDDGDDLTELIFIVPENVTDDEVFDTIKKAHDYLCDEDETDIYGKNGRNSETLAEYICNQKEGWKWEEMNFDVEINLD